MRSTTPLQHMRNIGIFAHIDAGKTTTTERILFYAGKSHKIGEVHEGEAIMDTMDQERERGITIQSAATTISWKHRNKDYHINIIDTPGHVDFTVEVQRSARVLDGAVVVVCGNSGVQPQTQTVFNTIGEKPCFFYVNKMDHMAADYFNVVEQLKNKLGVNPLLLQIPIGTGETFQGVVDLIANKAINWKEEDQGITPLYIDIPEDLKESAALYRRQLIETLALEDEILFEKYEKDPNSITETEIIQAIRKTVLKGLLKPVICGSSFKNKGVQPLINTVCDYLPSPIDTPTITGQNPDTQEEVNLPVDKNAPFSALVFKITNDRFGKLAFIRIYTGELQTGTNVYNASTGKTERISRLLQIHSNKQTPIDEVSAGDICAIIGPKNTLKTGDTLCSQKDPILLESIKFSEPVISYVIEPKNKADLDKLNLFLIKLQQEDPTFRVSINQETGETIIQGLGELHLDIKINLIEQQAGIQVNKGAPQVTYKEKMTSIVEEHIEEYKKQTGGRGKYAKMHIRMEPVTSQADSKETQKKGLIFNDKIKGGNIPKEFIPSIQEGLKKAMKRGGPKAGFEVEGIEITLMDGATHTVDSDQLSFELCAQEAFKNAAKKAKFVIMEPIMAVEIITSSDYTGPVTADLSRRRGKTKAMTQKGKMQIIQADVPLSELFGYITDLRTISSGQATASMTYSHHAPVPANLEEKIIEKK